MPSPKKIRQGITKATRRHLYEKLEGAEFGEAELTYAQNLLDKQPPAQVVAMLLRMAEPPLPREPMEVPPTEPRAWEPRTRPDAPMMARGALPRPSRGGYVRFSLSWGQNRGATASRCLSHVCRRAGINRDMIGAIDVGEDSTSIEIAEDAANEFEQRCRRPDPRDPHVRIVRSTDVTSGSHENVSPRNGRVDRPRPSFRKASAPHDDVAHQHPGPRVKRAARRPRPLARTTEA